VKNTLKTIVVALIIFFGFVLFYNIFNGPQSTDASSDIGETPWYISLLVSWAPMIVIFIFYIIFLKMFKNGLLIMDRIASALEKNSGFTQNTNNIDKNQ
jgi:hypothetical protein